MEDSQITPLYLLFPWGKEVYLTFSHKISFTHICQAFLDLIWFSKLYVWQPKLREHSK